MERERRESDEEARRYALHTETKERIDLDDPAYETDRSMAGSVFEHYKSTPEKPKYYQADRVIHHTESGEVLVVYGALYAPEKGFFARLLEMFNGSVVRGDKTVPRFKFIAAHD
jgi:hypothetical protein